MAEINKKQEKIVDTEGASSLAFNRLGAILYEIARDAVDNSNSTTADCEEGRCEM